MGELESIILDAIRESNRYSLSRLPSTRQSDRLKNEILFLIEDFDPDNVITDSSGRIIFAGKQSHAQRVKSANQVLRLLKGEKVKINDKLTLDGSKLSTIEVSIIQNKLQKIHTRRTNIPRPESITTDDELRNINSFEFLQYLADKIPESLRDQFGFDYAYKYCGTIHSPKKYNADHPYGNYYTEFLLALEREIMVLNNARNHAKKVNDKTKFEYTNNQLKNLDHLVEAIYSNPNYALERSYGMIRETVQKVRQTDEHALKKAVEERLKTGGSKTTKRKHGRNITKPRKAEFKWERFKGNYSNTFTPMMTTSQPSIVNLNYKSTSDPVQLRFGTQGQIVDDNIHINALFKHRLEAQSRRYAAEKKMPYEMAYQAKQTSCDLLVLNKNPTLATLMDLPLNSNAAFIQSGYKYYYVNKHACICKELSLNVKQARIIKKGFAKANLTADTPMTLSPNELQQFEKNVSTIHSDTKSSKTPPPQFTHIYFNNLSRVGSQHAKLDLERKDREDHITEQLENLENDHENIAVITLPSDNGLMNHHKADDHTVPAAPNYTDTFNLILNIANGTSTEDYSGDFHISEKVKKVLYGDGTSYSKTTEKLILEELLTNSFTNLGFKPGDKLSPADQQAVYFHFIKFELTNFIIKKINPETFNFACKDAIDRGGASSAYYNLMKSISVGKPISQDEFERILHGAPTLVKGRGMNKHTHLVWSAINTYMQANKDKANAFPDWLIRWRYQHALTSSPLHFVNHYIDRLSQYRKIRGKENEFGIFFGRYKKMSKTLKIGIVDQILMQLDEIKRGTRSVITIKEEDNKKSKLEIKALEDGRLGDITKELLKHNLIVIEKMDPELKQTLHTHSIKN